jgi:hypothetical protein
MSSAWIWVCSNPRFLSDEEEYEETSQLLVEGVISRRASL